MSPGRSIRLFLVDGTPNGLLTAEIMNWTGHVRRGRSANGRTSWLVEGSGQTYAAWQDQQLNSVTSEPETA